MIRSNGELLLAALDGTLIDDGPILSPYSPTNALAKFMGWGWHRTNNALKELGYRRGDLQVKTFSRDASNLKIALGQYGDGWLSGDNVLLNTVSVREVARYMGWGWHRTNNALKELGYR